MNLGGKANGFLGSEIVRQAVTSGFSVRGTDLGVNSPLDDIDYIQADILDLNNLTRAFVGMDAVIHCAGLAHIFDRDKAMNAPFMAVNATGTANVANAAAQAGVQHFVLISSVSVYGGSTPDLDERTPCKPDSLYAKSKYAAEQQAIDIAQANKMSLSILRMATLFGEGDPGNVARLMRTIDRGRFIWIGNGSNQKSLIYRSDAAKACIFAVQKPCNEIEIYNVSSPPTTMLEIVEGLASALGRNPPYFKIPAKLVTGSLELSQKVIRGSHKLMGLDQTVQKWLSDDVYDATKFCKRFGFRPQVGLMEGLQKEVNWYKRRH